MRNSPRWSNGSVNCRLEWRPSRLLQAVLILLGVLGAVSVLASELPRPWAWPVAVAALAWGGSSIVAGVLSDEGYECRTAADSTSALAATWLRS